MKPKMPCSSHCDSYNWREQLDDPMTYGARRSSWQRGRGQKSTGWGLGSLRLRCGKFWVLGKIQLGDTVSEILILNSSVLLGNQIHRYRFLSALCTSSVRSPTQTFLSHERNMFGSHSPEFSELQAWLDLGT